MLQQSYSPNRPLPLGLRQKSMGRIVAAVIVCESWLAFAEEKALRQWANAVLQCQWPQLQVAADCALELIVGRNGAQQPTQAHTRDLLRHVLAKLQLNGRSLQFANATGLYRYEDPYWCLIAVERG